MSDATHNLEYLAGVTQSEEPLAEVHERQQLLCAARDLLDETASEAKFAAVCRPLDNLSLPIKLIPIAVVISLGRFPRYDEDFEFIPLTSEVTKRCCAVSHRWTDQTNSRSDLDVVWLENHFSKIELDNIDTESVLLFYDFTSLPQTSDGNERTMDEKLTFKAGLELIDYLFATRSLIIPSKGYLFRYWCYVEFFITEFNNSHVMGNPFTDSLPRELGWMDHVLFHIQEVIKHPEWKYDYVVDCKRVMSMCFMKRKDRSTVALRLGKISSYTESFKIEIYKYVVGLREQLADVIRSRLRQCSITEESDKLYLNNLIGSYIDKNFDNVGGVDMTGCH